MVRRKEVSKHTSPPVQYQPAVLAIVSVLAVIVLVILLIYVQKVPAGKAFYVSEVGTAGIQESAGPIYENNPFTLLVRAHLGSRQATSVSFELALPEGVSCADLSLASQLPWDEGPDSILTSRTRECDSLTNTISFNYALSDGVEAVSGEIEVATISLVEGLPAGEYNFDFISFEIPDLGTGENSIATILDADISITVFPVCGDGFVDGEETCDDGNILSSDGCSNSCRGEERYVCSGEPSRCTLRCATNGDCSGGQQCIPITGICVSAAPVAEEDDDADGLADEEDNCQDYYNPSQADFNDDDIGDACVLSSRARFDSIIDLEEAAVGSTAVTIYTILKDSQAKIIRLFENTVTIDPTRPYQNEVEYAVWEAAGVTAWEVVVIDRLPQPGGRIRSMVEDDSRAELRTLTIGPRQRATIELIRRTAAREEEGEEEGETGEEE